MTEIQSSGTGIERNPVISSTSDGEPVPFLHFRVLQAELRDLSDLHNHLVTEREWIPHPSETLELAGNLFAFEDRLNGEGFVLLLPAPLPKASLYDGFTMKYLDTVDGFANYFVSQLQANVFYFGKFGHN